MLAASAAGALRAAARRRTQEEAKRDTASRSAGLQAQAQYEHAAAARGDVAGGAHGSSSPQPRGSPEDARAAGAGLPRHGSRGALDRLSGGAVAAMEPHAGATWHGAAGAAAAPTHPYALEPPHDAPWREPAAVRVPRTSFSSIATAASAARVPSAWAPPLAGSDGGLYNDATAARLACEAALAVPTQAPQRTMSSVLSWARRASGKLSLADASGAEWGPEDTAPLRADTPLSAATPSRRASARRLGGGGGGGGSGSGADSPAGSLGGFPRSRSGAKLASLEDGLASGSPGSPFGSYFHNDDSVRGSVLGLAANGEGGTPRGPRLSVTEATLAKAREGVALFHPASAFMKQWDLVTLLLLAFTATVTPFEVAFLNPVVRLDDGLFWVDRIVDFLFAVDVFINFNLAYYDAATARMVTGRCHVALNYLRGSAVLDIVSTIPFDLIGQSTGADGASNLKVLRILRIFRLFKLLRVLRSSRVLQRLQDSVNVNYGYLTLVKFACSCVLIAHWMACLLHLVQASVGTDCNWVNHYYGNLEGRPASEACLPAGPMASIASRYVTSLYWSVMTISTVGYGDVPPQSDAERAYIILGMLLGASTYAYVVGTVCGVVASLNERATEHERAMDQLNRFVAEANLEAPLAGRLRAYFRYAYTASRYGDWASLLTRMSPGLRGATALAMHGGWMASVPLLAGCPLGAHVELAFAFAPMVVPPGEALLAQNARAEQLIAIQKGLVMISGEGEGLRAVLGPRGVVGEQLLWANRRAAFGALTLTFVEAHGVSRERLLAVLDAFPAFSRRARAATVAAVLRETLRQLRGAAKRVEALIASDRTGNPGWDALLDACQPPGCGCDRHVESYCQLTPALQMMIVRAAGGDVWVQYTKAARAVQRAFRAFRRRRAETEAAHAALAAAHAATRRSAAQRPGASPTPHAQPAAAAAAAAPPADVAAAVLEALAPQLRALTASHAELAADVARLRAECAAALAQRPRQLSADVASDIAGLRRATSGGTLFGGSPPRPPDSA